MTIEGHATPAEICTVLGCDRQRLIEIVREGLPWKSGGKRTKFSWDHCWFDDEEAADWLIEHGYLSKPRLVATVGEVAEHFGVTKRAIWQWREQGCPLGDDGYHDIDLIESWYEARRGKDGGEQDETRSVFETDRARIRAEREQLELDQIRGRLVDVQLVHNVIARHIAEAATHLDSLAEFELTLQPAGTKPEVLKRIRSETQKRCDEIRSSLADALEALAEEIEQSSRARSK